MSEEIKALLKENVLEIVFTKSDGTSRAMKATLIADYLPKKEKSNGPSRNANANVTSVWSVDDSGWRCFRNDSVVSYIVLDGEGV